MSVTLSFVAFGYGTNFRKLETLVFIVPFKTLALVSFLCGEVWVLDLLGWGDEECLDIEAL